MSADQAAALSQAEASIGHALDTLEAAGVHGRLVDDLALIAERFARREAPAPEPTTVTYSGLCGRPLTQGGTDAFCTLPDAHEGACVWAGVNL